MLKKTVDL